MKLPAKQTTILMYKAPRQLSMKQRQSRTYYHLCSADGTISMLNVELGERVGTQQMTGTEI
jgi:hypothetical protein